jgi:hypothetical protein
MGFADQGCRIVRAVFELAAAGAAVLVELI